MTGATLHLRRVLGGPAPPGGGRVPWAAGLVLSAALAAAGCGASGTQGVSGDFGGLDDGQSVNGLGVLAGLFEIHGHEVRRRTRISPDIERYNVIVWAPDDFAPPALEARNRLEDWLASEPGRTLIFIGRDYDARPAYWRQVADQVPAAERPAALRAGAAAQAEHDSERLWMPQQEYARWFTVRRVGRPGAEGEAGGPWAAGIDPRAADLWLEGRLDPPQAADAAPGELPPPGGVETLLTCRREPLLVRLTDDAWGDGQIFVAGNGSFLCNLALVNPEHRELADRLVQEAGPPGRVLVLESGAGGVWIDDREHRPPVGWEAFTVWPVNVICLHLAVLGLLYCALRFSIFGRPGQLPPPPLADFGRHVAALGELFRRTQDEEYARRRIQYYLEHVRRDSGASHVRRPPPSGAGLPAFAPPLPSAAAPDLGPEAPEAPRL